MLHFSPFAYFIREKKNPPFQKGLDPHQKGFVGFAHRVFKGVFKKNEFEFF